MVESLRSGPAAAVLAPTDWPSLRLGVGFVLDVADLARDGGSVLDTLILALVIEANLAAVNPDPALQRAYGGLGAPAPDELRRPVSMSGVAASLSLPFETVRRRITRLAGLGQCVIGPKGVLVPAERLTSPEYLRTAVAGYERTRRFYWDLQAVGAPAAAADPEGPRASPPLSPGDAPVGLCGRLLLEYCLRVVALMMRRLGDPVSGLIMLGLARANLSGLNAEQRAASGLLPEAVRKPVRRSALAHQLGLPGETVRRRLAVLEQRGYCRATREGIMISADAVIRPETLALLQENQANLTRLMGRLRRCGVLDLWDLEPAAGIAGE